MATLAEQWDSVEVSPTPKRPNVNQGRFDGGALTKEQRLFQLQSEVLPNLQARINGPDPEDSQRAKADLDALYTEMKGIYPDFQPPSNNVLPSGTTSGNLADLWDSPETAIDENGSPEPEMGPPISVEVSGGNKPLRDTLKGIASVLDNTIGGVIPYTAQQAGQLIGRVITEDPKEAAEWGQHLASILDKPFGKAFGITDDPAYKNEATRRLFEFVGENAHKGAEWIEKNTGGIIPKEDAEWMINMALPKVVEAGGGLLSKGKQAIEERLTPEATKTTAGRVEPIIIEEAKTEVPTTTSEQLKTQFETKKQKSDELFDNLNKLHDATVQNYENLREAQSSGDVNAIEIAKNKWQKSIDDFEAAKSKQEKVSQPVNQLQEQLKTKQQQEAEPLGSARQRAPDEPFTPIEYAELGVSRAEQKNRAATLQRLGFDEVRENVIEGHGKDRATDYQTSKTDTPLGNFLKEEFDKEKKTIDKFAQNLIKDTGGTFGLDESSVYSRGNTILDPLRKLEESYDKRIKNIYKERDAIAKEVPVVAKNVNDVLKNEALTVINTESMGLAKGVEARMRQLGMIDKEGNLLPTDAHRSELLRQYLNENWDRKNAGLHKALKNAIDEDVIANLDTNSSLYKDARNLVEERKNTLDNPKGISNILDASGPKEINRKVDVEKIPNSVAGMPVEQFTHVIDTLKNVPEELRPLADKALSEIKAQFANRAYEALNKNANQLTKFLDANREKMSRLFTPEEMSKFRDLHNGVHILKTDTGYPGAKAQAINIEQKLGQKVTGQLLSKGSAMAAEAVTGGKTMGAAGTLAHEFVRKKQERAHQKRIEEAEKTKFEKEKARYHKLSDLLED